MPLACGRHLRRRDRRGAKSISAAPSPLPNEQFFGTRRAGPITAKRSPMKLRTLIGRDLPQCSVSDDWRQTPGASTASEQEHDGSTGSSPRARHRHLRSNPTPATPAPHHPLGIRRAMAKRILIAAKSRCDDRRTPATARCPIPDGRRKPVAGAAISSASVKPVRLTGTVPGADELSAVREHRLPEARAPACYQPIRKARGDAGADNDQRLVRRTPAASAHVDHATPSRPRPKCRRSPRGTSTSGSQTLSETRIPSAAGSIIAIGRHGDDDRRPRRDENQRDREMVVGRSGSAATSAANLFQCAMIDKQHRDADRQARPRTAPPESAG